MIILTRKIGEGISIGDDTIFFISKIIGNKVSLNFSCSHNITLDKKVIEIKIGESLNINNIKISILRISGRNITFGIEAPSDVVIHRTEINVNIKTNDSPPRKKFWFIRWLNKLGNKLSKLSL